MLKIILLMLMLIPAFFTEVPDIEKKSVYFEKYLEKQFNISPEQDRHLYMIIKVMSCENCFKADGTFIEDVANRKDVTIILSSRDRVLPKYIRDLVKRRNILLDRGKYYKLNITPLTDALIVVENEKVQNIAEIHFWRASELSKFLK